MKHLIAVLSLVCALGVSACGSAKMTTLDETAGSVPVYGEGSHKADKAYSSSLRK